MNHIERMILEVCPDGVRYCTLGDLFRLRKGDHITNERAVSGIYPVITASRGSTFTHNEFNFDGEYVTISSHGAYAGHLSFFKEKFWLGNNVYLLEPSDESALPRFYFHVLKSLSNFILGTVNTGGIPYINAKDLLRLKIPHPPLSVQREIVTSLDKFTELEAVLEAELNVRILQLSHILNELQNGKLPAQVSAKRVALKELIHFEHGKAHEGSVDPEGECQLITSKFISTNGVQARRIHQGNIRTPALKNDIAMVLSDLPNGRALAKCFFVKDDLKFAVNQRIAIIRSKNASLVDPEYLFHYLNRNPQILRHDNGSTQTNLKQADVENIKIHLPDIESQRWIAAELTKFNSFVNDVSEGLPAEIRARYMQYEYYRDKLLSFSNLEVA